MLHIFIFYVHICDIILLFILSLENLIEISIEISIEIFKDLHFKTMIIICLVICFKLITIFGRNVFYCVTKKEK